MTDDLMRELVQLQQYAAGLQGLLATAQADAPRSSEGTDRTGTIRAFLGPDGQPNSFRIEPGWNRKIPAENFGGAVLEAFQAAIGERLAIWTRTLEQQGWQAQADRLRVDLDKQPSASGQAEISAFGHFVEDVTPRPVDQIAEDMIKAFDQVGHIAAAPPQVARGAGSSRSDKLVLTLSAAGLVSCTADPEWVSTQTAASLMNALGEALTAARADLEDSTGRLTPSQSLDRLFTEALALLRDPRHVVDS